ncbi:GlxA family transcriptional regulator [Marinicella sp. W31]|uniref:GlxA family transcriptional regulator n=1 Tax=Marinicella sp. W31 TaxID=3023713 RepID=UPI003757C7BB
MEKRSSLKLDSVFIISDGFNPLDLFGPISAWTQVAECLGRKFDYQILSLKDTQVKSDTGTVVLANGRLEKPLYARNIIIPGGSGIRLTTLNDKQLEFLNLMCSKALRVASVCTGTFLLAQLDCCFQRKVTTHWKYSEELIQKYPHLTVSDKSLYIQDDKVWSSGGVTAGIDMTLAIIKSEYGNAIATEVARELLVYLHRPGNQNQYSTPLKIQSFNDDRFIDLLEWIQENLHQQLTLEKIAQKANYSPRHLSRLFQSAFRRTPSHLIEQLRMDRARVLLAESNGRISEIALSVGYVYASSFRRVFERYFGLSPQAYRQSISNVVK